MEKNRKRHSELETSFSWKRGRGELRARRLLLFGEDHSSRWAGAVVPVAAALTGGLFEWRGQARSKGSERMLRTLKVTDSKTGSGSKGDTVIYWLLGGSRWPKFEVTGAETGNESHTAFIFTWHELCSTGYAKMCLKDWSYLFGLLTINPKAGFKALHPPSFEVCSPSAVVFLLFTQHSLASILSSLAKWDSLEHKALMREHTKAFIRLL